MEAALSYSFDFKSVDVSDSSLLNDACVATSPAFPSAPQSSVRSCATFRVAKGLQRVEEVRDFYKSQEIWYEANLTEVLRLEIASARSLSSGDVDLALQHARDACELEIRAVSKLLPTSTSLYFLPGTAFGGVMLLHVASDSTLLSKTSTSAPALWKESDRMFSSCLNATGRPRLPLCLLGRARANRELGRRDEAASMYELLLRGWSSSAGTMGFECNEIVAEAKEYIDENGKSYFQQA